MPVSLNYHSGGIKVEEIASSTGLGWSLNAGGIVSRSVRGMEDEDWGYFVQPGGKTIIELYNGDANELTDYIEQVHERMTDGEPDIFVYNFSGISGKFIYDPYGNASTFPYSRLKISIPSSSSISITSEEGTVYSFEKTEEINTENSCNGQDYFVQSAWFLTRIESADGTDLITLEYDPVQYSYSSLATETDYVPLSYTHSGDCLRDVSGCFLTHKNDTHRLRRINFASGYVNFNYNKVRCDLVDDKSMDEIEIYATNDPNIPEDDELIKKYDFNYSYFGDNSDGCHRPTEIYKRLRLDSIQEKSGTTSNPVHSFEYNTMEPLPSRYSLAQDHWGYYNGKINNQSLIAQYTITQNETEVFVDGADRNAYPRYAMAGLLERIKYPTGGTTEFTYEGNTSTDERLEKSQFTTQDLVLNAQTAIDDISSPYLSHATFEIPSGGAEVEYFIAGLDAIIGDDTAECNYAHFYVLQDDNRWKELDNSWNGVKEIWPEGEYRLEFDFDCYPGNGTTVDFSIAIRARVPVHNDTIPENRNAGGLRIKKIVANPEGSGSPVITEYSYEDENDPSMSSGVLINFPDYGHHLQVTVNNGDGTGQRCRYHVRTSHSNYPLATTQGAYVGYAHVIERQGQNGETQYAYNTYSDISPVFPYAPVDNHDFERGRIRYRKDFAKDGEGIKKVRTTHYSYNSRVPFLQFYGTRTGRSDYTLNPSPGGSDLTPEITGEIIDQLYEIDTWSSAIASVRDTVYGSDDISKYVATRTDYVYSDDHYQLITEIKSGSKGPDMESKFWYPEDYEEIGNISELLSKNIVGIPIKEENHYNGSLSSGTIKKLDAAGRPSEIFEYEGDKLLVSSTHDPNNILAPGYGERYHINYDISGGNIKELRRTNGINTIYLWGYKREYPIAKIENATYDQVEALVPELETKSNEDVDRTVDTFDGSGNRIYNGEEGELRQALDALRDSLPDALVTTYTYDPLIGVTSITDPRGYTIYYSYDSFNRLKEVRDQDDHLVSDYEYHYRGQQND